MAFEQAPLRGVTNQYGTREAGGGQGVKRTAGITYEAVLDFDGDRLPVEVVVPAGAVVTHVNDQFATGAISVATVGAVDVSGADGSELNYVPVPLGGELAVTGPTAGFVVVKYEFSV